jgi:hypothetical protein
LDDFLAECILFAEFLPVDTAYVRIRPLAYSGSSIMAYMVSSTFSGVSLPWICFMASPALSMAARVSRLILADSIALICCSSVPICETVCSRLCSCAFLRRRAAFAAIGQEFVSISTFYVLGRRKAFRLIPAYPFCWYLRSFGLSHLAHPSDFVGASLAFAACPAVIADLRWRS